MEFSQICYSSCHFVIGVIVRLEGTPEDLDQDVEEVQALVIIDTLRCLV
jgi:hypothetical protein